MNTEIYNNELNNKIFEEINDLKKSIFYICIILMIIYFNFNSQYNIYIQMMIIN